jgi:hypothetical protein
MSEKKSVKPAAEAVESQAQAADAGAAPIVPPAAPDQAAGPLQVRYRDGPAEMFFFGRRWQRDKPQSVSADDWRAMQARADCAPHQFSAD